MHLNPRRWERQPTPTIAAQKTALLAVSTDEVTPPLTRSASDNSIAQPTR